MASSSPVPHSRIPRLSAGGIGHQLDLLLIDLRYSVSAIRRVWPLSLAVVLILVAGVSMNAIVFSLFNTLLLRPPVSRDPSSFVQIHARVSGSWNRALDGPSSLLTLEEFDAIRSAARTMSSVTASRWASFTLNDDDVARLRGKFVSCNYLTAHVGPMRAGRGLSEHDCAAAGVSAVGVLTERAWNLHFARDAAIVGRVLRLNDHPVTVVGVAPDDTAGDPVAAMIYVPYTLQPLLQGPTDYFRDRPGLHAWLSLSGRLQAGGSLEEAQTELNVIANRLDRARPGQVTRLVVTDGAIVNQPDATRTMPVAIALSIGTTALVLLVVCANVGTLLLARAVARRREMATRISLGATRGRLLRQLLAETMVLGGCAAVISVAMTASLAPRIAQGLTDFPLADTFTADWRVFAVTFGVALAAGIAGGLSPAAEALRFRSSGTLTIAGRGEAGPVSQRLSGGLIANQLSISLALLIAVGLLARTQGRLLDTRMNAEAAGTVITSIDLTRAGYSGAAARRFYDRLVPMLEATPGVRGAALSSPPPFAPVAPYAIDRAGVLEGSTTGR